MEIPEENIEPISEALSFANKNNFMKDFDTITGEPQVIGNSIEHHPIIPQLNEKILEENPKVFPPSNRSSEKNLLKEIKKSYDYEVIEGLNETLKV